MSQINHHIASSVAQVQHNAAHTAKARDRRRADTRHAAQAHADRFEKQLNSPQQADDPDAQLPDRQAPGYEQLYLEDPEGKPIAPASLDQSTYLYASPGAHLPAAKPTFPLYQHLDIQA